MRKASGQFEGGEDGKIGRDRWHFLGAAQMEVPALAANLVNVFVAASPGVNLRGTDWIDDFVGVPGYMLKEGGSPMGPLKCGVEEWARTFHLVRDGNVPEWVCDAVACTFCQWAWAGKPDGVIRSPGYGERLPSIDYSLLRGSLPVTAWNPTFGPSKEEMEEALTRQFNIGIAELDRIEKEAERGGLKKASRNFNPDHFRWAAKYQVGAVDVDALAERLCLKKRILWSAISTTLASVVLTQRVSRRGRPPIK